MKKIVRDLVGEQFGRLKVIEKHPEKTKDGHTQWVCKCTCGGDKVVSNGNLVYGKGTKSCGCYKREVASRTAKITNAKQKGKKRPSVTKPGAAFRMLLRSYKRDAFGRNYRFELPIETFRELTSSVCYYCGSPPSKTKTAWSGEIYTFNGIDRLDNSLGYRDSNCVPCCWSCNHFKGRENEKPFLDLVSKIYNYRIKIGEGADAV